MSSKTRVLVLFGGRSAEHEISIRSARNVIASLDPERYEVAAVRIDRRGRWEEIADPRRLGRLEEEERRALAGGEVERGVLVPQPPARDARELLLGSSASSGSSAPPRRPVDVVFPVLHGPGGEDGSIQGFLELAGVPYVGPAVLGSALGMDKDIGKRLLAAAGVPVARHVCIERGERARASFEAIATLVPPPLYVKPANMGSSVGVSRVEDAGELDRALDEAFRYDHKVVVEEEIRGRELECAVLGGTELRASAVGEIVTAGHHAFYSYDAKYMDEHGAALEIPARLDPETEREIRRLAVSACRALCVEGMARVDFFLSEDGRVFVNELNTIPGFTDISMFPRLWEASGLSYGELVDELVRLALERGRRNATLSTLPPGAGEEAAREVEARSRA